MAGSNRKDPDPWWPLRYGAFAIGIAAVAAGPAFHFFRPELQIGWSLIIAGLIFMVASRFDDIVEIGFGSFRATLERRVQKVEDAMGAVRRLAKESARGALITVQSAGRKGGFTEPEKARYLRRTRELLRDLGLRDPEIAEAEADWHRAVELDYAIWALDGAALASDWKRELGGIENPEGPEKIRARLKAANMLTPEREEILKDYEHYLATREHRREDFWNARKS
jgi:hypothetical protein